MADGVAARPEDLQHLYSTGDSWLHRVHPLTKLAAVPALTLLAISVPGYQVPGVIAAAMVLAALISGTGGVAVKSLRILLPISAALLVIHVPFNPMNETVLVDLGVVSLYQEGLNFALTTVFRLAVFVLTVALALWTSHPKALVTALIQKGVSHKICYSYLAGAELIPDMRARAEAILEAQQSRGFDTKGGLRRRAVTLIALMKPLLVGALISVETRTLALESRGFSLPGKRSSTVELTETRGDRIARWAALAVALLALLVAILGLL
ncbi:MAG: energy-coupling factor transporter transmembrane component T [Anaerolineales bacterium]|nr:energy-coupling factor transporter transmembrane component T [Anaerolineales bacterium]